MYGLVLWSQQSAHFVPILCVNNVPIVLIEIKVPKFVQIVNIDNSLGHVKLLLVVFIIVLNVVKV